MNSFHKYVKLKNEEIISIKGNYKVKYADISKLEPITSYTWKTLDDIIKNFYGNINDFNIINKNNFLVFTAYYDFNYI